MYEALKKCMTDSDAVIDADLTIFYPEAKANKTEAIQQLVLIFCTDEDHKLQKISFETNN